MKKKRGSYLKGHDVALGGIDDTFYWGEQYLEGTGKLIGKAIGLTPKQAVKKNLLLKNLKELESKAHATHSPAQRHHRILASFQKPMLDAKLSKLRKVSKRFPQG